MKCLKFKMGYECCLAKECKGWSEGLTLMWNKELKISDTSFSKHYISALIKEEGRSSNHW